MRLFGLHLGRRSAEPEPVQVRASMESGMSALFAPYTEDSYVGDNAAVGLDPKKMLAMAADNPWEWGSALKIAESAAMARFVISRGSRKGAEVENHPWKLRLEEPNDLLSEFDLWESTFAWLESFGNTFWLLDRSENPPLVEVVSPLQVKVVKDGTTRIKGYEYTPKGAEAKPIFYKREDVVHFRTFNPHDSILGMPPQIPLRRNLQTDRYATEYNIRFFRQGANISGVLETEDHVGEMDVEFLRKQVDEKNMGVVNSHRPLILPSGLKWHQTGAPHKDAEFLDGRKYDRDCVLGFHGVPPVLMGVLEHANYSNVDAQYQIFWGDRVTIRQVKVASKIQQFLRKETGDRSLVVWFDNSDVPALQEPVKTRVYRIERYVKLGVMSRNEARAEEGLEPVDGGDMLPPITEVTHRPTQNEVVSPESSGRNARQLAQLPLSTKGLNDRSNGTG